MTSTPHDAFFKTVFKREEHTAILLQRIIPAALRSVVDWTTLERIPGSFIDQKLKGLDTDLLFRAKLPGFGTEIYFYILLEHQSTLDPQMPRRMLGYAMSYWDEHCKQSSGPLPIVLPILICHVPGGWTAPTTMQALFDPSPDAVPGLAQFVPHISLLVEDLSQRSNEDLRGFTMQAFPTLALWLLRDAREPARLLANLTHWVDAWAAALSAQSGAEAFMQLMSYVAWVLSDEHFETFRETITKEVTGAEDTMISYAEKLIAQGLEKGREEGREEGRKTGRTELLSKQLALKFGELSATHLAELERATPEQLDRYAARVLTAETIDAVFAD